MSHDGPDANGFCRYCFSYRLSRLKDRGEADDCTNYFVRPARLEGVEASETALVLCTGGWGVGDKHYATIFISPRTEGTGYPGWIVEVGLTPEQAVLVAHQLLGYANLALHDEAFHPKKDVV